MKFSFPKHPKYITSMIKSKFITELTSCEKFYLDDEFEYILRRLPSIKKIKMLSGGFEIRA
jgi:hypothetical protein